MSCYTVYYYNILDEERIKLLGPLAMPIVEKFGGELVVASHLKFLEGSSPYKHMVVYKFKNKEMAIGAYESKEGRELSKLRREITEGFATMVSDYEEA